MPQVAQMPRVAQVGWGTGHWQGGESGNSSERKRRKNKSLQAQVNYCCAASVLFMWGEGLVRLLGVGGL